VGVVLLLWHASEMFNSQIDNSRHPPNGCFAFTGKFVPDLLL